MSCRLIFLPPRGLCSRPGWSDAHPGGNVQAGKLKRAVEVMSKYETSMGEVCRVARMCAARPSVVSCWLLDAPQGTGRGFQSSYWF
jgi:hypothetical protein